LATLDHALQTDPRLTIRRLFILDQHQRSRLYAMTDQELRDFIRPVFDLIHSARPETWRLILEMGIRLQVSFPYQDS